MARIKRILSDGILDFGKHKGKTGTQALRSDPGYLLWCVAAGIAELDADLKRGIAMWADNNNGEAVRAVASGKKLKRENDAVANMSITTSTPARAAPPNPIPDSTSNPSWGSW